MSDEYYQPTNAAESVVSTEGNKHTGRKWGVGVLIVLGLFYAAEHQWLGSGSRTLEQRP